MQSPPEVVYSSWPTIERLSTLSWEVGHTSELGVPPETFVLAKVPGAVQLDWARAAGYPDYTYGDNFKQYRWMEDVYWIYRARLDLPPVEEGERVYFVCGGVDYRFQVLIAGRVVHDQEGMFTPFEIDLSSHAQSGDLLEIVIFPAPKAAPSPEDRSQARLSNKPPVSYGWDWHPRLIPCGIWQETGIVVRSACHFKSCDFGYRLNDDLTVAEINVEIETSLSEQASVSWRLWDPEGTEVVKSARPEGRLEDPRLWWPAGLGRQEFYTLEVFLNGALVHTRRIGFRRVRLVMHEGAWDEPRTFPKSRSHAPITLEVNGQVIFARGSNWVCPEIFPGIISEATYRPLLELAKNAHFNILRTWGGAIINKESFYDLCDELGIMVWTEFHLACNLYDGGDEYLSVLDQESRSIIRRVSQHPSLALWCGGNELFNVWSGMTDQSLALRLLAKNCYELDRETPFIPTAPIDGMGHGDYRFRDEQGREPHQIFASARNTAYSEFGCPGPSDVDYLRQFMPENELFPPRPGTSWEWHHGLAAWNVDPGTWLAQSTIEHYFGKMESLGQLVHYGQLLQCEGYKCIFEEARRQKPVCSMALNWCFNEPWPSAANNSIVNWPHRPKASYEAVKAACRPVLASARIPKYGWQTGEAFSAELWLLNDSTETIPGGTLDALLECGGRSIVLMAWPFPDLAPNQNLRGPSVHYVLPSSATPTFALQVRIGGRPHLTSVYVLACKPHQHRPKAAPGQRFLND